MLERQVKTALLDGGLAKRGANLVVAVSGGADSVAMLYALNGLAESLDLQLTVAHLDHRLRTESAEDRRFVETLARTLKLPCKAQGSDVRRAARRRGISIEMAARAARYRFLARTAKAVGADAIATAHTQGDVAETVILNLARGTGTQGVAGIPARSHAHGVAVIRPMLDVCRADIEAYLAGKGVDWREDVSNTDRAFLRNRVRHEIMPVLASRLNPAVQSALARTANVLREEDAWIEEQARRAMDECRAGHELSVKALLAQPLPLRRRILRLWTGEQTDGEPLHFGAVARIEALLTRKKGTGTAPIGAGRAVRRDYDRLVLSANAGTEPCEPFRVAITLPGEVILPEQGLHLRAWVAPGIEKAPAAVGAFPARGSISLSTKGRRRLYFRSWRAGDRMRPMGMSGSRKLQDIFVDAKLEVARRDTVPLLECGGEIVWIPGYRPARDWAVETGNAPAIQLAVERI